MDEWIIGANDGAVVAIRRDLHRHPELGFLEYRTAAKAAAHLDRLGFAVQAGPEVMVAAEMLAPPSAAAVAAAQRAAIAEGAPAAWVERMPGGQTGLVAQMVRGDGPTVALRFDMDALPVFETAAAEHRPNRDGYRSTHEGVMHACGHDGHTAIGLAVAERLAHPAANWRGTVKLIFQPAEEGGRGARPMVAAGIVDDVDHFFAGHLGCFLPSGQIAAEASDFLFSNKLDVTFSGKAAHAAMAPQDGRNALLAGAAATLGLYGIARRSDAVTHVNVGTLVAGSGRNIIADSCRMQIEVRGSTGPALDYMSARAAEVLAGAAAMQGATHEVALMGMTIGCANSPAAARRVAEVAGRTPGIEAVVPSWPIGGGDDATFMMRRVQERGCQAVYFLIGSDIPAVHHAADFDIDEASLDHGVRLFTGLVEDVLAPRE